MAQVVSTDNNIVVTNREKALLLKRHALHSKYKKAVELYRNTGMTMAEVAEACKVSLSGFGQHLRFYHKEILEQKKQMRKTAKAEMNQIFGEMTGNGRTYKPSPMTEQKYAVALALYRDTTLTMKKIVEQTGVPEGGFRSYLHLWHKDLVLERSGIDKEEKVTDLRRERKRMKTVAAKLFPGGAKRNMLKRYACMALLRKP